MTSDDIFAVTDTEGGNWLPFSDWLYRAHSIMFKDGQTWDEINGFRGKLFDYTPRSMEILRDNWDTGAARPLNS